MTIFYNFEGKTYINLTNECPCSCVFCIRKNSDSVADNDSLWLEHQPSFDEVVAAFEAFDTKGATEAVFCGYGEPTAQIELLVKTAEYLKANTNMKLRLNTNGLVKLLNSDFDISRFKGLIDSVSISLNAPDAKSYNRVTRPKYGEKAFDVMMAFAEEIKAFVPKVAFTVVDVITEEQVEKCHEISERTEIPLRVRHYITDNENYQ